MKQLKKLFTISLSILLSLAILSGCTNETQTVETSSTNGVMVLKVNPEIEINYDENGNVTWLSAKNKEAADIIANYSGYEGKACKEVVSELVKKIGDAGYFVEDVDGNMRQITIEVEKGSYMPSDTFLDEVMAEVKTNVETNNWKAPIDLVGESDYGYTDYVDTDYGINNDGYTDYNDTDYGPNNDGVTDYNDTDYGPNNDGVTDYNDTDYGPNNDGVTDYNDTDYGPNNDGVTDYNDTDYGPNKDGVTDYSNDSGYDSSSDYGNSNYGSDYN